MSPNEQTSPLAEKSAQKIESSQDFIKIGSPAAVLPPTLLLNQKAGLAEIVQCTAHGSAGEVHLPRYRFNGRPADTVLIGTILQVHIHSPRPVGQIGGINRIEVPHRGTSRTQTRTILSRIAVEVLRSSLPDRR